MDKKCEFCKFYMEKLPRKKTDRIREEVGRCRHNAPVAGLGYPYVHPFSWCGQFRPDENKV